jgi:lysophospholipase L1-like esterase
MNSNRRVLLFVVYSIGLFLLISLLGIYFRVDWLPFNRINLISDVVKADSTAVQNKTDTASTLSPLVVEQRPQEDFSLYNKGHFITNFNADTSSTSIQKFISKMHELKSGKKRKVRIAYFGDSMIEGDLMTQTLRKLLQQAFGGNGVGFVPITSPVSKFRQTVFANTSDGWQDENFKQSKSSPLFLSGHLFHTSGGSVQMTDNTIRDSAAVIQKSLLFGKTAGPVTIAVNSAPFTINGKNVMNRAVMINDINRGIRLAVTNDQLPVYGVSFESDSGVFVDNFSFRGITGIEFAKFDSSFLSAIAENNPYDLIIFQYGVNLLFRPNDKNFKWYAKALLPIIRKLHNSFTSSDIILVSTADRAFRYGAEYKSAIGIDSLIKAQALVAYETGSSFYNQYETMGGKNSIVDWANRKPSLANRDYVHPNHRGAEVLGTYFFEAIMQEYHKYLRTLK